MLLPIPIEIYSKKRQAEFLLSNAIGEEEYEAAKETIKLMGFNPKSIPHYPHHWFPKQAKT